MQNKKCQGDKCVQKTEENITAKHIRNAYKETGSVRVDLNQIQICLGDRGSSVVNVLCYKSEGRWFDPRWCYQNFSMT